MMSLSDKSSTQPEPLNQPPLLDPQKTPPKSFFRRFGRWLVFAAVLLGGILIWRNLSPGPAVTHSGKHHHHGGGSAAAATADAPVPVVAGISEAKDFPIYLNGLGTVEAYNSVLVRPRVDGELQQVFFEEGQDIQKGDKLAQIDPRPFQAALDQAKAKLAQDQAQWQNANLTLSRNTELLKNKVIDQQSYDTQKYATDRFAALVQADQAAVASAQTQLDYTGITSPIAGRVGIRMVDAGNIVQASGTTGIVMINQVQPISVLFTLPQQELGDVRTALMKNKNLSVLAVTRDNVNILSSGTLAVLDNQIDPTTATVKLKATFGNGDFKLWPGQFVNVRLLVGNTTGAIVVPSQAVQRGPKGTYVYVINADNKVDMRDVVTGNTEGDSILIKSGLKAGEKIVVDGQYRLQQDASVDIVKGLGATTDTDQ